MTFFLKLIPFFNKIKTWLKWTDLDNKVFAWTIKTHVKPKLQSAINVVDMDTVISLLETVRATTGISIHYQNHQLINKIMDYKADPNRAEDICQKICEQLIETYNENF